MRLISTMWKNGADEPVETDIINIFFQGMEFFPASECDLLLPQIIVFGDHTKALSALNMRMKPCVTKDGTLYISPETLSNQGVPFDWKQDVEVKRLEGILLQIWEEDRLKVEDVFFKSAARGMRTEMPKYSLQQAEEVKCGRDRCTMLFILKDPSDPHTKLRMEVWAELEGPGIIHTEMPEFEELVPIVQKKFLEAAQDKREKVYLPFLKKISEVLGHHLEVKEGGVLEELKKEALLLAIEGDLNQKTDLFSFIEKLLPAFRNKIPQILEEEELNKISSLHDLERFYDGLPVFAKKGLPAKIKEAFDTGNTGIIEKFLAGFKNLASEEDLRGLIPSSGRKNK